MADKGGLLPPPFPPEEQEQGLKDRVFLLFLSSLPLSQETFFSLPSDRRPALTPSLFPLGLLGREEVFYGDKEENGTRAAIFFLWTVAFRRRSLPFPFY